VEGLLAQVVHAVVTMSKTPLVVELEQEPQAGPLGDAMMMQHLLV
jgi:hypothetical protein